MDKVRVFCEAKTGTWQTQTCGASAKFYAESLCQDGKRTPLCGTHANRWKRCGHQITPIHSSASGAQEQK